MDRYHVLGWNVRLAFFVVEQRIQMSGKSAYLIHTGSRSFCSTSCTRHRYVCVRLYCRCSKHEQRICFDAAKRRVYEQSEDNTVGNGCI